jgi:small subunit ribosomal protein S33
MAGTAGALGVAAAKRLAETAARIFGNVVATGERSGRKLLARPLIGDKVAEYYGQSTNLQASDPLFEDPLEKRCVAGSGNACKARMSCAAAAERPRLGRCVCRRKVKLERLKRRGKSPPKKGQGKRAGKR